jgi:hypothetical protein
MVEIYNNYAKAADCQVTKKAPNFLDACMLND